MSALPCWQQLKFLYKAFGYEPKAKERERKLLMIVFRLGIAYFDCRSF